MNIRTDHAGVFETKRDIPPNHTGWFFTQFDIVYTNLMKRTLASTITATNSKKNRKRINKSTPTPITTTTATSHHLREELPAQAVQKVKREKPRKHHRSPERAISFPHIG